MHCRTADIADLDAIVAAWRTFVTEQRAHGSRVDPDRSEPAIRNRLVEWIIDDGVSVAEVEERVVGFVCFHRTSGFLARDVAIGFISYLYVDQSYRGRGIGRRLMERAEQELADRGVDVVELEVLADNRPALAFYESVGYAPHRRRLCKELSTTDR